MIVPYIRVPRQEASERIRTLRKSGDLLTGLKIQREGAWVFIPVKSSSDEREFEELSSKRMSHTGSFERISDFFVIKERDGWDKVLKEILAKQEPRAVYLDRGVKGPYRVRDVKRVFGIGEPRGIHKENGLRYMIDIERAYFSPRLASLRKIIADRCVESGKSALVVDMYAGVGPISVPISKRGVRTISIDANPSAIRLLSENMKLNKTHGHILVADSNRLARCFRNADHVVMNNPTQSIYTSQSVIDNLNRGTIIHFTHISDHKRELQLEGVNVLEVRTVHGYSPSSSLLYYRLRKK